MRSAARITLVLLSLLVAATISHCQPTSAVIAPQASVYSQTSLKSRVVRTLDQGQRVLIDMTISNSEGTWCLIREPNRKENPGYIPCSQLTSDALPKVVPTVLVFDQAAVSASVRSQNTAGDKASEQSTYQEMLHASGLEALRDDLAATLRRYGVTDSASYFDRILVAAKNPYSDSFFLAVEPKIRRGGVRFKVFWKTYWNSLSEEQKTYIANRNQDTLLAYLGSQSDPETGFTFWVLGYMKRSKQK